MAVFGRRWNGRGFDRRRYLGHILVRAFYSERPRQSTIERARVEGRKRFGLRVRSCDLVEVESDNGRRRWYGVRGAEAPGGVGLL